MNYLQFILTVSLFAVFLPTQGLSYPLAPDKRLEISITHDTTLHSQFLGRKIIMDIVLPPQYSSATAPPFPLLLMNDGQDFERLNLRYTLQNLYQSPHIYPFVLVAVYCGERIQEYGVAAEADYKKRGSKAHAYTQFILKELLPYLRQHYRLSVLPAQNVFCGFSLGGLSAFDIVWHHPDIFGKVGVFSGSFWWRSRAYENHYDDHQDRIMQRIVRESQVQLQTSNVQTLQCWFQTGTNDERDDRNQNGIIDAIEDTLDLIVELEKKGFRWGKGVQYVEVEGGTHDPETWAKVMPDFLQWAFGETH